MPLTLSCPSCQKPLRVADTVEGKRVRCPKCTHVFLAAAAPNRSAPEAVRPKPLAPRPRQDPDDEAPPARARRRDEEVGEDADRPRRRRPAKEDEGYDEERRGGAGALRRAMYTLFWVLGAVGGVLVLGLSAVAIWFVVGRSPTLKPVANFNQPAGVGQPDGRWTEYVSTAGRFRVMLPGTPQTGSQPIPGGGLMHHVTLLRLEKDLGFFVHHVDVPGGNQIAPEAFYDKLRASILQDFPGGQMLGEKAVDVNGIRGREFTVQVPAGKAIRRIFLVQGRMYMNTVSSSRLDQHQADVDRFFSSFQVTQQ